MADLSGILDDAVSLPWKLFMGEVPSALLVEDQNVLDEYDEKAGVVWDGVIEHPGERYTPEDGQLTALFLLAIKVFSSRPGERVESLRAAFEACWHPEHRGTVMTAGESELIWTRERAEYLHASKQGDQVASAMMHMMDVLKKEGGRLRMAMAGEMPALLWEDMLRTADARTGVEADALLVELAVEDFATWIGDKPYLLLESLIWSAPKIVTRLSRTPQEKAAIVKAGGDIFSAILDKHPEAWSTLGELVKGVVEDDGIGALEKAETEASTTLGPDHQPGAPILKVTEGEDGEVKVERVHGPLN